MANFTDILNQRSEDIERPKPLPIGTYLFTIPNLPKIAELGKAKNGAAEYQVRCMAPQADVDQAALTEMGGCQGKEMRLTFWLTPDAMYRWKEFLEDVLGIEPNGRTIGQYHNDAVNRSFLGVVKHTVSQDGTAVYANIDRTLKAQ